MGSGAAPGRWEGWGGLGRRAVKAGGREELQGAGGESGQAWEPCPLAFPQGDGVARAALLLGSCLLLFSRLPLSPDRPHGPGFCCEDRVVTAVPADGPPRDPGDGPPPARPRPACLLSYSGRPPPGALGTARVSWSSVARPHGRSAPAGFVSGLRRGPFCPPVGWEVEASESLPSGLPEAGEDRQPRQRACCLLWALAGGPPGGRGARPPGSPNPALSHWGSWGRDPALLPFSASRGGPALGPVHGAVGPRRPAPAQGPAVPSPPGASVSLEPPPHSSWSDVESLAGSRGSRRAPQSSFTGTWS